MPKAGRPYTSVWLILLGLWATSAKLNMASLVVQEVILLQISSTVNKAVVKRE
jgi:hypothetical protein